MVYKMKKKLFTATGIILIILAMLVISRSPTKHWFMPVTLLGTAPSVKQTFITTISPLNTLSVSPTPTSVREVSSRIEQKCALTTLHPSVLPDGVIVLQDGLHNTSLLNLKTGQELPLGQIFPIMAISPDFKSLAYTDEIIHKLVIIDSIGEPLKTISIPDSWQGVIQWASAENLLLEKFIYSPYGQASTVFYNITTGDQKEFAPSDYPHFEGFTGPRLWGNYSYSSTVYDTTLTRVIYPETDDHGNGYLVLWDIPNQHVILKLREIPDPGAPQWTRDGSHFITGIYPKVVDYTGAVYENVIDKLPYQGGFDLFDISRDGDIRRLTYLTTKYVAAEEEISLSPDHKHLAFWLNLAYQVRDKNAKRNLAILDLSTGEILDLCISGGDNPYQPIWSPDGKYLAITAWKNGSSDVMVVDLVQGFVVKIAHDKTSMGWLLRGHR